MEKNGELASLVNFKSWCEANACATLYCIAHTLVFVHFHWFVAWSFDMLLVNWTWTLSTDMAMWVVIREIQYVEQWRRNRNTIGGGLAWEAVKQPIIRAKRPRAKVKKWGPPGSAALDVEWGMNYVMPGCSISVSFQKRWCLHCLLCCL